MVKNSVPVFFKCEEINTIDLVAATSSESLIPALANTV